MESGEATVGLWAFSEAIYREPGVEALCLRLQDEQQLNVLILLWCLWLEALDRPLSTAELALTLQTFNRKSQSTLLPLRELRRGLKTQNSIPEETRREVRQHLLQAELSLEKQLLAELESVETGENTASSMGLTPLSLLVEVAVLDVASSELSVLRGAAHEVLCRLQAERANLHGGAAS